MQRVVFALLMLATLTHAFPSARLQSWSKNSPLAAADCCPCAKLGADAQDPEFPTKRGGPESGYDPTPMNFDKESVKGCCECPPSWGNPDKKLLEDDQKPYHGSNSRRRLLAASN